MCRPLRMRPIRMRRILCLSCTSTTIGGVGVLKIGTQVILTSLECRGILLQRGRCSRVLHVLHLHILLVENEEDE
jgi:hypothetical protein